MLSLTHGAACYPVLHTEVLLVTVEDVVDDVFIILRPHRADSTGNNS